MLNKGFVILTFPLSQNPLLHLTLVTEECKWKQPESHFWLNKLAKVDKIMILDAGACGVRQAVYLWLMV